MHTVVDHSQNVAEGRLGVDCLLVSIKPKKDRAVGRNGGVLINYKNNAAVLVLASLGGIE